MKMREMTYLQKLSRDILDGTVREFENKGQAEDKIRGAIIDACGGEWNMYKFEHNKNVVYEIMAETIDLDVEASIEDAFSEFMDIHNVNLMDTIEFEIEDKSLFRVGVIAAGNTDIRRQTLINGKMTVSTERIGVKIYTEFEQFVTGRIDWSKMVARVVASMANEISIRIYNALIGSIANLPNDRKSAAGYSDAVLRGLIKEVEVESGKLVNIYGTKYALAKVKPGAATDSEAMKDRRFNFGYYDQFEGTPMIKIPNGKKRDGSQLIADNFLLIAPAGEKILKMVIEGEAVVKDWTGHRQDEQLEHMFSKKIGIAALIARDFAVFQIA